MSCSIRAPEGDPVDQEYQFISKELDLWAYGNGVVPASCQRGKPTAIACAESFNAIVRMECLGQHWFVGFSEAQPAISLPTPLPSICNSAKKT